MKKILIVAAIILGSIGFSINVLAELNEQQAKDIIKKEVPNGQITKFKLDKENGKMVYEIKVMDGNIEKEYEIDAETGAILKMEQEQKGNKNANSVNNPKISSDKAKEIALKVPPLLLISSLVHDFLCIHPFYDGNGRMSRLLTLLLLYKNGFFVGKYISLEMIIEDTKDIYYEQLQASSENWHSGENDELPFIKYMLSVIYKAYVECDERFRLIGEKSLTSAERIMKIFEKTLKPLSKSDIVIMCPDISQRTIERALKELKDTHLIKQIGSGRATKYIKA